MISVIIPVYNTEKYLARCVDSVLDSTYEDFELILVNDGSEDRSLEICQYYCGKDKRIRLIDQKHKGVSEARNRGIRESHGEWIIFIDSDDMISNDFFQTVIQEEFQGFDLLVFDYVRKKKGVEFQAKSRHSAQYTYTCRYEKADRLNLFRHFLNGTQLSETGNMSLLSPCAKAYKRTVLEQHAIQFPLELVIGEDRIFNLEYIMNAEACMYIQKKVYCLELRPDSAMHGFNPLFLQNDLRYQKRLRNILAKKGVLCQVKKDYYNSVLSCMADVLIRGIYHPKSNRSRREDKKLCDVMQRFYIYRRALKYNSKAGVLPRRLLLFFFRSRCYCLTSFISKISYRILENREEL